MLDSHWPGPLLPKGRLAVEQDPQVLERRAEAGRPGALQRSQLWPADPGLSPACKPLRVTRLGAPCSGKLGLIPPVCPAPGELTAYTPSTQSRSQSIPGTHRPQLAWPPAPAPTALTWPPCSSWNAPRLCSPRGLCVPIPLRTALLLALGAPISSHKSLLTCLLRGPPQPCLNVQSPLPLLIPLKPNSCLGSGSWRPLPRC